MKRFSSSYVYEKSNFALIGCDAQPDVKGEWYQFACVASNIVQRGTPTKPSKRLRAFLGSPVTFAGKRPARKVYTHDLRWDSTIKGVANSSFNPAREFYEDLLPAALPEGMAYVMNYVLPEAAIEDIVEECDPRFTEQQVDFYCSRARMVVEIDGSQHSHAAQAYLDKERVDYLEQQGIRTLRIPVSELDAQSAAQAIAALFDSGSDAESARGGAL